MPVILNRVSAHNFDPGLRWKLCHIGQKVLLIVALAAGSFGIAGCDQKSAAVAKPAAPAKIDKVAQEDQLNTIRLTPEAEQRLGIVVAQVESRDIERLRTYAGEIALPTGASIVVSAPVAGTIQPIGNKVLPVGAALEAGQPVFSLLPLLSPERSVLTPAERIRFAEARTTLAQSQIDAAGQVQQAQAQVEAAQIALARAERLLREQAGTARAVDDAKAQMNLASKALEAAESRKKLVDGIKLDEAPGKLEPLVITSPRQGILRAEHAAPGEVVVAGAPLFEVMDRDPVWVRVSIYAGDVDELALDRPALISGIADRLGSAQVKANPIAAPPTAAPLASAIDCYYELPNAEQRYKPGERVTAKLAERTLRQSLTVPWSAIMHDIQGGSWVYECVGPQTFVRRRVEVRYVLEDRAILAQGPAAGKEVVTAGVVELYGSEFGFAK